MGVLTLQIFVSLTLVVGSLILFAVSARRGDHEHADRLALFPIEDDSGPHPAALAPASPPENDR